MVLEHKLVGSKQFYKEYCQLFIIFCNRIRKSKSGEGSGVNYSEFGEQKERNIESRIQDPQHWLSFNAMTLLFVNKKSRNIDR
jgi:hypothetical protein